MRILIVDDNERLRRGLAAVVASESDWQICGEAENGMEAIDKTRQLRPDLVLLDVSMPGLDGFETARRMRGEFPAIKIVILSLHDPSEIRQRALEAGANACLDKLSIATELVKVIRAA